MKNSGIPWIGEIPEHWEVCFIKQIMRNKSIKGYPDEMVLSLYRDYGVIPKNSRSDNHNVTSEDTSSYKFVEVGDFVINKMKAWQGSMAVSDYQGIISPAYYICRFTSKEINKRYIHYLLRNDSYKTEYMRLSSGLRVGQWDLNVDDFLRIKMICPSLSEQQKIAEFLDKKCGEVDEMIALQEQIIEELKAYKQSVITEAVTKGLNPNVPMKDSGIEWIGEIPEHWEIKKIKHLSHVVRGGSPRPAGDLRYYVGNIPFMKVADITKDDKIYVDKCEYTIKEAGLSHTRMIKPNTLLLTNSGATLGVPKINTFDTTFNDGIAAFLNLDISLDIIFAYYSLKARTQYFLDSASLGIGQPNLNTDIIGSTYLLVPPFYEQQIIVDFLNEKCADVDALISIKQRKIESLKEYKKSIIYEYVTGKKEV